MPSHEMQLDILHALELVLETSAVLSGLPLPVRAGEQLGRVLTVPWLFGRWLWRVVLVVGIAIFWIGGRPVPLARWPSCP